jgi:uncharacterized protein (TIGR00369 family)
MARITREEVFEICRAEMPLVLDQELEIVDIGDGTCRVRQPYRAAFVRPGGTISGPTMMGLADCAMWIAVMSVVGRAEMAVTTNLNINFLKRPKPVALIAECRILKAGKRLAYGEVSLFSEGEEDKGPVAHITSTYSLPPRKP